MRVPLHRALCCDLGGCGGATWRSRACARGAPAAVQKQSICVSYRKPHGARAEGSTGGDTRAFHTRARHCICDPTWSQSRLGRTVLTVEAQDEPVCTPPLPQEFPDGERVSPELHVCSLVRARGCTAFHRWRHEKASRNYRTRIATSYRSTTEKNPERCHCVLCEGTPCSDAGVQERGCWALNNLTYDPDNMVKAGSAGAIECVLAAMRAHAGHTGVQAQAGAGGGRPEGTGIMPVALLEGGRGP